MDPLAAFTLALALSMLFAGSVAEKLAAPARWLATLRNYRLVSRALAPGVALLVPVAEATAAVALLPRASRGAAATLATCLLALFGAALWINIRRGRTAIDCGCFGSRTGRGIRRWMVWRNALLALLAASLLLPSTARSLSPFELAMGALCALSLAFLYPVAMIALEPLTPLRPRAGDDAQRFRPFED
jgi:hypothetical protein